MLAFFQIKSPHYNGGGGGGGRGGGGQKRSSLLDVCLQIKTKLNS